MKCVPVNVFMIVLLMITKCCSSRRGGNGGYQRTGTSEQSSQPLHTEENYGEANYKFEYGVDDGSTGTQFGHEEERNGKQTRGQYRVLLPDGRLQIVTYTADENGYRADVTYENPSGGSGAGESRNGGYNSNNNNRGSSGGGGGYGNLESSAAPTQPPSNRKEKSYSNSGQEYNSGTGGGDNNFGSRNGRNFVKLRRTVDGRMFNYMY